MKRVLCVSCLLLALMALPSCRSSNHGPEATQEKFGVSMARMNLWREALFRFRRAVEISPADAQAHNNLAVAYEANGDFEAAAKEYREAMRLDKSNQYIQKNYSRLVEFTSRNKKRQRPPAAAAAKPASEAAAAPAGATSTAPPSTAPAEPVKQEPPPTMQGIGGSGAPPATKPVVVPQPTPVTPPPTTAPPPPEPPKSGGQP